MFFRKQRTQQAQKELTEMIHNLGEEIVSNSFVTEVELTLSTKIGPVSIGLKVKMDPSKLELREENT
jgi:hypothetical protein